MTTERKEMMKELVRLQGIYKETVNGIDDRYQVKEVNDWLRSERDILQEMINKIRTWLHEDAQRKGEV